MQPFRNSILCRGPDCASAATDVHESGEQRGHRLLLVCQYHYGRRSDWMDRHCGHLLAVLCVLEKAGIFTRWYVPYRCVI